MFKNIDSIEEFIKKSEFKDSDGMDNSVTNTISESEVLDGSGTKTVKQPEQPTKQANLEVLVKNIIVSADSGTAVEPMKCPGVGRVEDYGKDSSGEPVCVYNGKNCPYFDNAAFKLDGYYKIISCTIDRGA